MKSGSQTTVEAGTTELLTLQQGRDMEKIDKIYKIHNRQRARLLAHLEQRGLLTKEIEVSLKRAFRYTLEDIKEAIGQDKE